MPRTWDRKHPSNDKDPTANKLDYDNPGGVIDEGAEKAGDPIHQFFSGVGKLFNLPTPQDFLSGVATGVENLWNGLTYFAKLLGGFLDPTQVPVLDPSKILNLPGVIGNVRGFLSGVMEALTGAPGDPDNYVDPVNELKYFANTVSGHTQAIEELKAANSGSETGGISGGDNYQIPYTGSLGPGWAITSTNGITTYVDTTTGKAEWHNAGNANPTLTARRIDPADAKTLTEFQKVTITLATPLGGTNSSVRVHGRMSDNGLHYAVAYISNTTVFIGYAAGGAETIVDSGPLPTGTKLTAGTQISLECGTEDGRDEYRVRINDVNAQAYTDSTGLFTTSANYAARGLPEAPKGWATGWRPGINLGQWNRPATLSGCTIADNTPLEIQGHGFRVYRESTSSGGFSSSNTTCQHYDEIDYISEGSEWDPTQGYRIPKTGMWVFTHRLFRSGGNWTTASFGLKINGIGRAAGAPWTSINVACDTFIYHCKEGDYVTPYLAQSSGTVVINGGSNGLDSFFSGALTSPG